MSLIALIRTLPFAQHSKLLEDRIAKARDFAMEPARRTALDNEKRMASNYVKAGDSLVGAIIHNPGAAPKEFAKAAAVASQEQIALDEAEQKTIGFTHCDTGRALAEMAPGPAHGRSNRTSSQPGTR